MIPDRITSSQAMIYGAGGHGKAVLNTAVALGWQVLGFIDDGAALGSDVLGGYGVLATGADLAALRARGLQTIFVGVGGSRSNADRKRVFSALTNFGFELPALISTQASVALGAAIGAGSVVLEGAQVGAAAQVGSNCIINTNAVLSHDCELGDHSHLAIGALAAGSVTIGTDCIIGMGAKLLPGAEIADGSSVRSGDMVKAGRV